MNVLVNIEIAPLTRRIFHYFFFFFQRRRNVPPQTNKQKNTKTTTTAEGNNGKSRKVLDLMPPSPAPELLPLQLICFNFFRIKELLITCSAGMSLSHTNRQRRAWWLRILHKPTDFTHKHLTIKYDLVGEKPATKCSQNNQVDWKE